MADTSATNPYLPPSAVLDVEAAPDTRGRKRVIVIAVAALVFAMLRLRASLILRTDSWTPMSTYLTFSRSVNLTASLFGGGAALLLLARRGFGLMLFATTVLLYGTWRTVVSVQMVTEGMIHMPIWYICLRAWWTLVFIALAASPHVRGQLRFPVAQGTLRWWASLPGWALTAAGLVSVWPVVAQLLWDH